MIFNTWLFIQQKQLTLCTAQMQLGIGEISVSPTGLHWSGDCTESELNLIFPISVLSDVRLKRDPDSSSPSSFLLVTVRDALFVQFAMENETQCSELVDVLTSRKKEILEGPLQVKDSKVASNDLDDWYR